MATKRPPRVTLTLAGDVNASLSDAVEMLGSKKQVVVDRVLAWFADAPPEVQHAVYSSAYRPLHPYMAQFLREVANSLDPSPNSRGDAPIDSDAPKATRPAPRSARKGEQNTPAQ